MKHFLPANLDKYPPLNSNILPSDLSLACLLSAKATSI